MRHRVVGVEEVAALEGQAATADALPQIVPESDQLLDPVVELGRPSRTQPGPVGLCRGPLSRKVIEGVTDGCQRHPDTLGSSDEGQAPERLASEAALVAGVTCARDEARTFVEVQSRDRAAAALGQVADRQLEGRRVREVHLATLALDLNHC